MRRSKAVMAILLGIGPLAGPARADVILQNTAGTSLGSGGQPGIWGQSFTTPGGGPWTNVMFNLYSNVPATTPAAAGTAYIFTSEYPFSPASLSLLPGNVGRSTGISNGRYVFIPQLILQPGTQYFFYETAAVTTSGGNILPGGNLYFAPSSTSSFIKPSAASLNFLLTGTPISVPEPAAISLLASATLVLSVAKLVRRLACAD